jgi:hypothetical protein
MPNSAQAPPRTAVVQEYANKLPAVSAIYSKPSGSLLGTG